MRLLLAALVATALLLTPLASAAGNSSLGLSAPADPKLSVLNATAVVDPITVSLTLVGPVCTDTGSAKVALSVNVTGNFTASLDAQSVSFAPPPAANIGGIPSGPPSNQDYHGNKDVNLTVAATGPGSGTIEVVATFDGKVANCQPTPDPLGSGSADFDKAYKSVNITVTSALTAVTPTPTTTTSTPVSSTPTSTTVASSTPVSSSPVTSTPTDTTPAEEPKKSFLPGPTVPLVAAALVAVAVLLRRK